MTQNGQHSESKEIIDQLREGNKHPYRGFYIKHKSGFIDFSVKKYKIHSLQAAGIYKKAILILERAVYQHLLTDEYGDLKALLFQIGERICSGDFTTGPESKAQPLARLIEEESRKLESIPESINNLQKYLDDTCKRLVILIYYNKFSSEKVAEIMNLSGEGLEELKISCLNKLRQHLG